MKTETEMDRAIALENARRAGIDPELMERLPALTPEQRATRHDAELEKILAMERQTRERRVLVRARRGPG